MRLRQVCAAGCIFLCAISKANALEIPLTAIKIDATPRGDEFAAIDNNPTTFSYLTAPVSLGPRTAYLGFAAAAGVNTFRFLKQSADVDAIPENDPDYNETC